MKTSKGLVAFNIKKLSVDLLIAMLLASGFLMLNVKAATKNVCYSGCQYSTIQEAIDAANEGDVIHVSAGTYDEQLVITTENLTIEGEDPSSTIIKPLTTPIQGKYDVEIYASGVILKHFTFRFEGMNGDRGGGPNRTGITVGKAGEPYSAVENVQILNNVIHSSAIAIRTGLSIDVDGLEVSGNTIHLDEDGDGNFAAWDIAGVYINPNAGTGIVTISGNAIDGHVGYGIANETSNSVISGNTVNNNMGSGDKAGIRYIDWHGSHFSGVVIENNSVSSMPKGVWVNSGHGGGSLSGTVQGNTLTGNDMGIWLGSGLSTGFAVNNNMISGNTTAGLQNDSVVNINAKNNWWGYPSGPTHVSNPSGAGDKVSDDVDFLPWLNAAASGSSTGLVHNVTKDSYHFSIQEAIDSADAGDTIRVASGTFMEDLAIPVDKDGLILEAASGANVIIKGVATVSVASWPLAVPNIEVLSPGVKIHGFTIEHPEVPESAYASGLVVGAPDVEIYENNFKATAGSSSADEVSQAIQTYAAASLLNVDVSGLDIHDNTFTDLNGGSWGYEGVYVNPDTGTEAITIQGNQFSGNILRAISVERSNATISNNSVITDLVPIDPGFKSGGSYQGLNIRSGTVDQENITVSDNIVKGSGGNNGFLQGVRFANTSRTMTGIMVRHNEVRSNSIGVYVKDSADGIVVEDNVIVGNIVGVQNDDAESDLSATRNWWGAEDGPSGCSDCFGVGEMIVGRTSYDPWYLNASRTELSDASLVNAVYSSITAGQAELPAGVDTIQLTDYTLMDVFGGLSFASGGELVVAGKSIALNNFSSGDITGADLSEPLTIGGISLEVGTAVQLKSGTGSPITLVNSDSSVASVEFPDKTTIISSENWDGIVEPPRTESFSGNPLPGFSVEEMIVSVGSSQSILLFDKPVTITVEGTHPYMGYRVAGATDWMEIAETCEGNFVSPTPPVFPGRCHTTDKTLNQTKVLTYHFATFGHLVADAYSSGEDGGLIALDSNTVTSEESIVLTKAIGSTRVYSQPIKMSSSLIHTDSEKQLKTTQLTTGNGSLLLKPNENSTISLFVPQSTLIEAGLEWDGLINPPLIKFTEDFDLGETIVDSEKKLYVENIAVLVHAGSEKAVVHFTNEVTLEVPVNIANGTEVMVYSSLDGSEWVFEGGQMVADEKVVLNTDHLSYFAFEVEGEGFGEAPVDRFVDQAVDGFLDVQGHWAENYIRQIYEMGIVSGKTPTHFEPNANITRAELTKMAVNALGYSVPEKVDKQPFVDVETSAWYAPYVAVAKENKIAQGTGTRFNPDKPITRAAALKIIIEAAGFEDVFDNYNQNYASKEGWSYVFFPDALIGEWYARYIAYAKDFGIVGGYSDGTFRPGNSITRAEAAKIVTNVLDLAGGGVMAEEEVLEEEEGEVKG